MRVRDMRVGAICINEDGLNSARILKEQMPSLTVRFGGGKTDINLSHLTGELFREYDGLVFFCAAGIAIRLIAPYLGDKYNDPAVVVVDNGCRYAVSLLSGHEGGANELAQSVSRALGTAPVITTATEARKRYVLGIGTRRGVHMKAVIEAVRTALSESGLSSADIRTAATADGKCGEPGLLDALDALGIPLTRVADRQILSFQGAFDRTAAADHLGIPAVAVPCALLAAREPVIVLPLRRYEGVTVAVTEERIGPSSPESRTEGEG